MIATLTAGPHTVTAVYGRHEQRARHGHAGRRTIRESGEHERKRRFEPESVDFRPVGDVYGNDQRRVRAGEGT